MNQKNKYILISLLIVLFFASILLITFYHGFDKPSKQPIETDVRKSPDFSYQLADGYPRNLVEGFVISVDPELNRMVLKVRTDEMFSDWPREPLEMTIQFTDNTRFVVFDLGTREEREISVNDIVIWDDVVIATLEGVGSFFQEGFLTARVVTKMEGEPSL